jgi:hypothetical protein
MGENSSPIGDMDDATEPLDDGKWLDWPCCPECGRRRQTYCRTCDLDGDDFSLAEFIPTAAPLEATQGGSDAVDHSVAKQGDSVLLMCPSCDEAFAPGFYRLCQQCGYDFGDGLEVQSGAQDELTGRMLFVLIGLGGLAIAILIYFWYLFG